MQHSEDDPVKVMVVDDSPSVLEWTALVLRSAGYIVRTATDVFIAVEVGAFLPRLIMVDFEMGACNGVAVVKALKPLPSVVGVTIVLYSGLPAADLERLARDCGADEVIRKTRDPEKLLQRVRAVLGYR